MEPFDQDKEEEEDKKEDEEGSNESQEAANVKVDRLGYHPTTREIEEHRVNHLPYRE